MSSVSINNCPGKSKHTTDIEPAIDPRVKRTRKLLRQALAELMAEQDFSGITVQDIAARAEVNRATFYAHFEDKYGLLNYFVRESLRETLDSRLPAEPSLTPENLKLLTSAVADFLDSFHAHCRPGGDMSTMFQIATQMQGHIHNILLSWIDATPGSAHLAIAPHHLAVAAGWTIFGLTSEWVQEGRQISLDAVSNDVLTVLWNGLQPMFAETV